jgi:hypothetical protein
MVKPRVNGINHLILNAIRRTEWRVGWDRYRGPGRQRMLVVGVDVW